jgi:hypothetical protein
VLPRRSFPLQEHSLAAAILPEQLLKRRYVTPEGRLAAAVILQALADSREIHGASGLRKSALAWFRGGQALLSFDQACTLAGIDKQAAMEAIGKSRDCHWLATWG